MGIIFFSSRLSLLSYFTRAWISSSLCLCNLCFLPSFLCRYATSITPSADITVADVCITAVVSGAYSLVVVFISTKKNIGKPNQAGNLTIIPVIIMFCTTDTLSSSTMLKDKLPFKAINGYTMSLSKADIESLPERTDNITS
jgi:hypothetical protein